MKTQLAGVLAGGAVIFAAAQSSCGSTSQVARSATKPTTVSSASPSPSADPCGELLPFTRNFITLADVTAAKTGDARAVLPLVVADSEAADQASGPASVAHSGKTYVVDAISFGDPSCTALVTQALVTVTVRATLHDATWPALQPISGSRVVTKVYRVDLREIGGKWLVDGFYTH